eukprot:2094129-Prymnesium_polylepis.1
MQINRDVQANGVVQISRGSRGGADHAGMQPPTSQLAVRLFRVSTECQWKKRRCVCVRVPPQGTAAVFRASAAVFRASAAAAAPQSRGIARPARAPEAARACHASTRRAASAAPRAPPRCRGPRRPPPRALSSPAQSVRAAHRADARVAHKRACGSQSGTCGSQSVAAAGSCGGSGDRYAREARTQRMGLTRAPSGQRVGLTHAQHGQL